MSAIAKLMRKVDGQTAARIGDIVDRQGGKLAKMEDALEAATSLPAQLPALGTTLLTAASHGVARRAATYAQGDTAKAALRYGVPAAVTAAVASAAIMFESAPAAMAPVSYTVGRVVEEVAAGDEARVQEGRSAFERLKARKAQAEQDKAQAANAQAANANQAATA